MAARTTFIKSVAVAVESTGFANVAASTGIPSTAGLSFITAASIARADVQTVGESVANDNTDQVRNGPYGYNPEVATMWSGGSRVRRRRGEVTLTFNEVQGIGDGSGSISAYGGLPLYMLMHSGMKGIIPGTATDTVASGIDANSFNSTGNAGLYSSGGLFSTVINGRQEYSCTTDILNPVAPGQIDHSPAMSTPLTNEVLRFMATLFQAPDLSLDSNSSVALRFDGIGFRTYAYGCRMTSWALSVSGDRAQLTLTLSAAYVTDDHASAAVSEPAFPDGAAQHLRGSYVVIGSTAVPDQGAATPYAIGREAVQVNADSVTVTITNTYAEDGRTDDIVGMSDWCLVDSTCEATATLSVPTTTLDDDHLDRSYRSLLLGFAPGGEGNGLAVYIPAGFLTADGSRRDTGGDTVTMTGTWQAGPWRGDALSQATFGWPDSPFRVGLGL